MAAEVNEEIIPGIPNDEFENAFFEYVVERLKNQMVGYVEVKNIELF